MTAIKRLQLREAEGGDDFTKGVKGVLTNHSKKQKEKKRGLLKAPWIFLCAFFEIIFTPDKTTQKINDAKLEHIKKYPYPPF